MIRLRHVLALAASTTLVACGGSAGGSDSAAAETPTATNLSQFELVETDFENIEANQLTPISAERLIDEGMTTVMYNTELACRDGWQQTFFAFDQDTASLSSSLCDGTKLRASYSVNEGILVIYDMFLDGQPSDNPGVDYWGLLETEEGQPALACFDSYAFDLEESNAIASVNLIPPASEQSLDCSEESYLFYGKEQAGAFIASNA